MSSVEEDENRKKLVELIKKKNFWTWLVLGISIIVGVVIRTRNLRLLKDSVTGDYITLALDPDVFLRYAEYIVEHGKIMAVDYLRYFPLGKVPDEYSFLSYFIAYLYKLLHFFGPTVTIAQTSVLYPVIVFPLMILFYFLLVRKLFGDLTALFSSILLVTIPTFVFRTIAGYGDREPLAMMFMFAAFYFYIHGFKSEKIKVRLTCGLIGGVSTGLMALVWGGVKFVLFPIAGAALLEFLFGRFKRKELEAYAAWLVPVLFILAFVTGRYGGVRGVLTSLSTSLAVFVLIVAVIDLFILKKSLREKIEKKLPANVLIILSVFVIGLLILIGLYGSLGYKEFKQLKANLTHPIGTNRFVITVAENQQPYFTDWKGQFGLEFFYLFFFGSVLLFYNSINFMRTRHKMGLTGFYGIFLALFIFSRYSRSSNVLNGETPTAIALYLGSLAVFAIGIVLLYLYSYYKKETSNFNLLKSENILILVWFIFMIVAARGAIRLLFVLTPVAVILGSYFISSMISYSLKLKDRIYKITACGIILLFLFSPVVEKGLVLSFLGNSYNQATYSGSGYDRQWQEGMAWVRDNTPKDAVFAHWWDYGYWVQTGGDRATILDGGNAIIYWDHLMGRYVLTGQNELEALEFLKAHNATHLLIVADEIGKYTAFSSIGSDKDYDRYSWVTTFVVDPVNGVQEARNETTYVYAGTYVLDENVLVNDVLLPAGGAAIVGFLVPVSKDNIIKQPTAVLIYNNQRLDLPLKCLFFKDREYVFDNGFGGCLRLIPTIDDNVFNRNLPIDAAALYVSERGKKALWTNLYLFNKKSDYFKIVYDDSGKMPLALFRGRLIGPMKIWGIGYPNDLQIKPEYTEKKRMPDWFYKVYG